MGKKHSKSKNALSTTNTITQDVPPQREAHPWESISSMALVNKHKVYIGDGEGVCRIYITLLLLSKIFRIKILELSPIIIYHCQIFILVYRFCIND